MEKVIVERSKGIIHVKINRPDVLNACDGDTYNALADAWDELETNPQLRVGILSGAGSSFCVGTDIKWVKSSSASKFIDKLYPRILSLSKPVIAAIHGHCNGGGLEQALGADIRVATKDAQFGFGEVRLGWIPGGHGTQRLPRLIPLGKALELLFTAERINGQYAYQIGLVNHVVNEDDLMEKCFEIAQSIIKGAPLAVQYLKKAVMEGLDTSLKNGVEIENRYFKQLMQTADAEEGARAFSEKRLPKWRAE